jgi:hypothetical protein
MSFARVLNAEKATNPSWSAARPAIGVAEVRHSL